MAAPWAPFAMLVEALSDLRFTDAMWQFTAPKSQQILGDDGQLAACSAALSPSGSGGFTLRELLH